MANKNEGFRWLMKEKYNFDKLPDHLFFNLNDVNK
jgi:hypothetical protein